MSEITTVDEIVEHYGVAPDEILKGYRREIDRLELQLTTANKTIAELMAKKCERCEEREPLLAKMKKEKVHYDGLVRAVTKSMYNLTDEEFYKFIANITPTLPIGYINKYKREKADVLKMYNGRLRKYREIKD